NEGGMPMFRSICAVRKPIFSIVGDREIRSLEYSIYLSSVASMAEANFSAICDGLNVFSIPSTIEPVVSDTFSDNLLNRSFIKNGVPFCEWNTKYNKTVNLRAQPK